jgi:hypothetical protein
MKKETLSVTIPQPDEHKNRKKATHETSRSELRMVLIACARQSCCHLGLQNTKFQIKHALIELMQGEDDC